MTDALITTERAEAAFIRHGLRPDALHAALAVCHGRYSVKDSLHGVITTALFRAERAKVAPEVARKVAVSLFKETLAEQETTFAAVKEAMIDAAAGILKDGGNVLDAALVATELARQSHAPVSLIDPAIRIARWRVGQAVRA